MFTARPSRHRIMLQIINDGSMASLKLNNARPVRKKAIKLEKKV